MSQYVSNANNTQEAEAGLPVLGQAGLHRCLRGMMGKQYIGRTREHSGLQSLELSDGLSDHWTKGTFPGTQG